MVMSNPGSNSSGKAAGRKKGQYPRFDVLDGALVKVGWSKKQKSEYQQRIPEASFNRVSVALSQLGGDDNGTVPSDRILITVDSSGDGVPSYQVYAVLGFLRERGVLRTASRGEYVIPADVAQRARAAFLGSGGEVAS